MIKNNETIIQNTRSIFYNNYFESNKFIEKKLYEEIVLVIEKNNCKKVGSRILKLLNIYLYLKDENLKYINFKNSTNENLLNDFLKFITSNFITNEIKAKQAYKNNLLRIINFLNLENNFNLKIDENISFQNDYCFEKKLDKLNIINGIVIKNKTTNFIEYFNKHGYDNTNEIYQKVSLYSNHPKLNFNTLSVLVLFIKHLANKEILINQTNNKIISDFAIIYFNKIAEEKQNISIRKPFWNDFIIFINDAFNLNIDIDLLKIKTERRKGNLTNIKIINNKNIKNKLITDIPIEICDSKAIFLLKEKIYQDVDIVEKWAESVVESYMNERSIGIYPPEEFFVENIEKLRTKYKMWSEKNVKQWLNKNFNLNAIFQKKELFAIYCLLIIDNPAITESFIYDLTVDSIYKTDNGTYIKGFKKRKGSDYSEQNILLNERSSILINILKENSLKMGNLINSKSLNLHTNYNAIFKIIDISKISKFDKSLDIKESIKLFIEKNYKLNDNEFNKFYSNLTLTKLRASCGIKEFFKTESTKKMAEVLGHETYNSGLLTHYLPEPIIHFYQSRWIKIFQKGIIYEAMKDSEYLLKSIAFKNIDELDMFLRNHTIKNLPKKNIKENTEEEKLTECFISINEENLSALLSLKEAVDDEKEKFKINEKSIFWTDFINKLIYEINNNRNYYTFEKVLQSAKEKVNKDLYKKVIYE